MQNEHFHTSDWYLCVYLIAQGFQLLDIDKSNRARCQFVFEQEAGLDQAVRDFWHNGQVGAQDFVQAIKKAKALLHSDSY